MEPLTLNKMPVNVLVNVYSFLSLNDVLNLHSMGGNLRLAAEEDKRRFSRGYKGVILRFYGFGFKKIIVDDENLYCDIDSILRFLIIYGPTTRRLWLDLKRIDLWDLSVLFRYIFKYCRNLVSLIFENLVHYLDHVLERPFTSVRMLYFYDSFIRGRLCELTDWFPNTDELNVSRSYFEEIPQGIANFPEEFLIPPWENDPNVEKFFDPYEAIYSPIYNHNLYEPRSPYYDNDYSN